MHLHVITMVMGFLLVCISLELDGQSLIISCCILLVPSGSTSEQPQSYHPPHQPGPSSVPTYTSVGDSSCLPPPMAEQPGTDTLQPQHHLEHSMQTSDSQQPTPGTQLLVSAVVSLMLRPLASARGLSMRKKSYSEHQILSQVHKRVSGVQSNFSCHMGRGISLI